MSFDLKRVKRIVVLVGGFTVVLLGIVMLVAPGPGFVTIALGLGILATEFLWARRLLRRFRYETVKIARRLFGKRGAEIVQRLLGKRSRNAVTRRTAACKNIARRSVREPRTHRFNTSQRTGSLSSNLR
ncbi:MAG: PGPGW domain-containing protein [Candidatus Binataceae bacterium]